MSDTNFSLLSQEEIDTLIAFLTDTSNTVDSEVLSQESIDKLIVLMRGYSRKSPRNKNVLQSVRAVSSVLTAREPWLLEFEEEPESGFIRIYATDGQAKEYITPRGYSCACFVEDHGVWGYAVSPVQFVDIALTYDLKFEKTVYEQICNRYAEKNFGDSLYDVDDYFLAPSKELLKCLK